MQSELKYSDTSSNDVRDDSPAPDGKIYDLDIPGVPFDVDAPRPADAIVRLRANFKEFAVFDDGIDAKVVRCSNFHEVLTAQSYKKTVANDPKSWVPINDVPNDNRIQDGQLAKLTWNMA